MPETYYDVLRLEFSGNEGSFLFRLHGDMVWDTAALSRLTEAMLECCKAYDAERGPPTLMGSAHDTTQLPRWLVEGFWYVSWYVRSWTSHEAWKERISAHQDYYDRAYERLDLLTSWLFTGQCPLLELDTGFPPM